MHVKLKVYKADLLAVTSIDKDDKLIEAKKEIVFLRVTNLLCCEAVFLKQTFSHQERDQQDQKVLMHNSMVHHRSQ